MPDPAQPKDEELFVRLITKHENDIFRYVLSLTFNPSAVDDIVQDVSVALWNKFDQYDPARPFFPWACRFAYFEVLKHRSKMGKSREVFGEDLVGLLADDYEAESEQLLARREALGDCLAKMSETDQELVQRRYGSSDTIQSLAAERGTSVHKLYHGLERIRRALMECVNRTVTSEA